ncbi:serine hydrolase [Streptomyces qinzhouensis]|uniref:Serine hydrolase n=1 Tax=Streptomyces qinzhouensis TaxID=2599401 RepID=A0A5B8JKL1_9ACTN|nr:serine hydrolase [Streptomyces qinzhouensis]QDY80441.1 serine hydrolase [Streptomyces qinzhouensis]
MTLARVAAAARSAAALPLSLSVAAIDVDDGRSTGVDDTAVLPVASAAKLLLLAEVARGLDAGELDPGRTVAVTDDDVVHGTGLLVRLSRRDWTVEDLCWLTASVSDNTATNALLRLVGPETTARLARSLSLEALTLHDRVRDVRGPGDPPVFATGTARALAELVAHAARGSLVSPGASRRLLGWMRSNTDHTLAPALVSHDPYAACFPEPLPGGLLLANKTGTDPGVRADAGVFIGARRVAYAVVAHWDTALGDSTERAAVRAVRDVGRTLAEYAAGPGGD